MAAAFAASRKPLAAHFKLKPTGESYFVCNVHFASKRGSDPLFGPRQPPDNGGEEKRTQQATVVRNFAEALFCADPTANMIVLGDMNEFTENLPLQVRSDCRNRNDIVALSSLHVTVFWDGHIS